MKSEWFLLPHLVLWVSPMLVGASMFKYRRYYSILLIQETELRELEKGTERDGEIRTIIPSLPGVSLSYLVFGHRSNDKRAHHA